MRIEPQPLSGHDPDQLRARIVLLGEEWAELNGAADLLEETRKTVLAQLSKESQAKSMAEREMKALASQQYDEHLRAMVRARTEANKARVRYDAARTWVDMARSLESTRRAEMGLR